MKTIIAGILSLTVATSSFCQSYQTPLKLTSPRMSGPEVLTVQTRLVELGFSKVGSADGWFGPLTQDAVSSFQWFFGFSETGIVDQRIWDALLTDSKKQAEIESAIVESNAILAATYTKKSHDIMDRSTEGGNVVQYLTGNKIVIEDFAFYGELGKVESRVIHLAAGLVVLEKTYRYPEPFDIEHATITNAAYYFVGKTSVKISEGKTETSEIKSLSIGDLIGKAGT